MTLSLIVGGALSGIQLVQDESGDFLVETGGNIGERRQTREEILEGSLNPGTVPGETGSTTTTTSATTTSPSVTQPPTTQPPSTTSPSVTQPPTTQPPSTTSPSVTQPPVTIVPSKPKIISTGKPATSSSVGWGGSPSRATDGNTSGLWKNGSVTHTNWEKNPWLQIDLEEPFYIDSIKLFNRTDCCQYRLHDVYILVSDTPLSDDLATARSQATAEVHIPGTLGKKKNKKVEATGRYVRIFIDSGGTSEILSLAEVQIKGNGAP